MSTPTNNQSSQNTNEEKETFWQKLLKDIKAPTFESISHWGLYISIYITIFILFHAAFESAWDDFAVKPILSKLSTGGIYKDISIVFITLLLVIYLFATKRMIKTRTIELFTYIIILSAYIFYRFKSDFWNFTTLHCCKTFYYADFPAFIILIKAIIAIVLAILKWIPQNSSDTEMPNSSEEINPFQIDAPIKNTNDDDLGYSNYARNLAQRILATKADQGSFAIGVNATWGSGKTSFIEILRKELGEEDIIHVKFNPWDSHSPNKIIQDFFETLQTEFDNQIHSSLPKKLATYSNKLINLNDDNTIVQYLQVSVSVITGYDSIESLFNDINETIESSGKKIIIYIDDLDRLDNAEIVEVLKLVRNTANFRNTFFVVAYDRGYVVNAIGEHNLHDKEVFLSKIFQLEINLPLINEPVIADKLWDLLASYFNNNRANFVDNEILATWLTNMRDVKRLYNSFTLNIHDLKDKEINTKDFLLIELLRLKYPDVYRQVAKGQNLALENSYWKIENAPFDYIDPKDNSLYATRSNNEISNLLTILFSQRQNNGISSRSSFHYYFYYKLKENDIQSNEFQAVLESTDLDNIKLQIEEWLDLKKGNSFEKHLSAGLNNNNKTQLKNLLYMILHFAYLRDEEDNVLGFEIAKIAETLYDIKLSLNHHTRGNIISTFVVKDTKYWHPLADLLFSCFKKIKTSSVIDLLSKNENKRTELSMITGWAYDILTYYVNANSNKINAQTIYTLVTIVTTQEDNDIISKQKEKIRKLINPVIEKSPDSFIKWILSENKKVSTVNSLLDDLQEKLSEMSDSSTLYPQSKYLKVWHLYTLNGNTADSLNPSNRGSGSNEEEKLAQQLDKEVADLSITNQKRNYSFLG